jgi:hypothetical protein
MLTMYMWGHLDRAMTELPPGPPAELFDRFLRWTDGRLETSGCRTPLSQSA